MGKEIFILGEEAPAANAVKLAGDFLSAATIATIGEAFAPVRKSGVPAGKCLRVIESVLASSR